MTRGRNSEVGDERVSSNGYHYTRTKEKWELTHKLVAEKELGRKLADDEICRFVDGDRSNLDPSNIEVRKKGAKSTLSRINMLEIRIEHDLEELGGLTGKKYQITSS